MCTSQNPPEKKNTAHRYQFGYCLNHNMYSDCVEWFLPQICRLCVCAWMGRCKWVHGADSSADGLSRVQLQWLNVPNEKRNYFLNCFCFIMSSAQKTRSFTLIFQMALFPFKQWDNQRSSTKYIFWSDFTELVLDDGMYDQIPYHYLHQTGGCNAPMRTRNKRQMLSTVHAELNFVDRSCGMHWHSMFTMPIVKSPIQPKLNY